MAKTRLALRAVACKNPETHGYRRAKSPRSDKNTFKIMITETNKNLNEKKTLSKLHEISHRRRRNLFGSNKNTSS